MACPLFRIPSDRIHVYGLKKSNKMERNARSFPGFPPPVALDRSCCTKYDLGTA
jgi:hypothetical protein